MTSLKELTERIVAEEATLRRGSNPDRQKKLGRLTVRERLHLLLDNDNEFLELQIFAAYGMYQEWGGLPAAGVVTGIGKVSGINCMIIANDATVKAGAMFPQSVKKVLRAQKIAFECRLPILYLVDSSGIFLPLQDEVFPDEDDFGRIFRNNAVFSANGIPQFAAIMGNCIAGGGYLPVLCDQVLMTKGSGLYLAGPALVKAAIGQVIDSEELGGVNMHAKISGTVDYEEEDDESCLKKLRLLVSKLPSQKLHSIHAKPSKNLQSLYEVVSGNGKKEYDIHDVLEAIVDEGSFIEYKKDFGRTIVAGFANIHGIPIGVVANQKMAASSGKGETEIGGVIYTDSADKAARFVMECNQMAVPLVFLQDVVGFMVGKEAEASGIIKSGAIMASTHPLAAPYVISIWAL
jgi:3-methylcrotonyl-CoA carboxylase beta subunit